MTEQTLDLIEIGGIARPLASFPEPLPRPYPNGHVIEFDAEATDLYRGYRAIWRLAGSRLMLAQLDAFGCLDPTHENGLRSPPRPFTLADVFGSDQPVHATWVTAVLKVAEDVASFRMDPRGNRCARWRFVDVRAGIVVGHRFEDEA